MVIWFENPQFEDWEYLERYNLTSLPVDHAIINLTSINHKIWMYKLESECTLCPFEKFNTVNANEYGYFIIPTVYSQTWKFFDKNQGKYAYPNNTYDLKRNCHILLLFLIFLFYFLRNEICTLNPDVGQFGIYNVIIDSGKKDCQFKTEFEAVNINLCEYTY